MGTLEDARSWLRYTRRQPYANRQVLAEPLLRRIVDYQRELVTRNGKRNPMLGFGPYDDEIEDLKDVAHEIAIACPAADRHAVWRGRTRGGFRVAVVRHGQKAIGRRGRARVEDAFAVIVDGDVVGVWHRAAAFKQARWATLVADGRLSSRETMTGQAKRRTLHKRRRDRKRSARLRAEQIHAHHRFKTQLRRRDDTSLVVMGKDVKVTWVKVGGFDPNKITRRPA